MVVWYGMVWYGTYGGGGTLPYWYGMYSVPPYTINIVLLYGRKPRKLLLAMSWYHLVHLDKNYPQTMARNSAINPTNNRKEKQVEYHRCSKINDKDAFYSTDTIEVVSTRGVQTNSNAKRNLFLRF
jgi:hypothetical protein